MFGTYANSRRHFFFSEIIRLDISCESSATIYLKYQILSFSKNNNFNFRLSSTTNHLLGALKVKPMCVCCLDDLVLPCLFRPVCPYDTLIARDV